MPAAASAWGCRSRHGAPVDAEAVVVVIVSPTMQGSNPVREDMGVIDMGRGQHRACKRCHSVGGQVLTSNRITPHRHRAAKSPSKSRALCCTNMMEQDPPQRFIFHREGGLKGLYGNRERLDSGELIPEEDFIGDVKTIYVVIDPPRGPIHYPSALKVDVIQYKSRPGDPEYRNCTRKNGATFEHYIGSYTIADPGALARHNIPEYQEGLERLVEYIYGCNWKTGSAFITGEETLGIEPVPEDAQKLAGKRPCPRTVTVEMDFEEDSRLRILADLFCKFWASLLEDRRLVAVLLKYIIALALRCTAETVLEDRMRRAYENNQEMKPQPEWVDPIERSTRTIIFNAGPKTIPKTITRAEAIAAVGEYAVTEIETWADNGRKEQDQSKQHDQAFFPITFPKEIWGAPDS
ncbi:uncharacterized protein B0I36DRAFT_397042 [Microdochium trichocladiopsis]|uniref:Uncharacterized protein n=1 Tax=Microdochium trichocladiopsis TaxID=1682393 RepID=A0A9P9BMI6_9PEZI|nr:uncharacterized protein B0I36DRAFT_397042 [Microdochium trichocladiopsis]KAH7016480.1 hypothetical protein B0I36DRAFT_397042 [Microdochium trichocladiopsis]